MLEDTKKLKSSPNIKENAKIDFALGNVSLISSAALSFKNSKIKLLSATYKAMQLLLG
jgi:hypothetical protein